jgi:serine/threonine protein kinase
MTFHGTSAYAAPETLQRNVATFATNAWSAGVVVYAVIEGELPFDADDLLGPVPPELLPPTALDGDAAPLLACLLEWERDQRWSAEAALALLLGSSLSLQKGLLSGQEFLSRARG